MAAASILALLLATGSHAATGEMFAEIFAPPGLAQRARARAEYRHYGDESVNLRQTKLDASVPVASTEESRWRAHAQADYDALETKERFANGRLLPNRLWDLGAGVSHSRNLDGDRTAGGGFTVSSPGDRPFGRGRDFGFNLNLTYKVPAEGESAWIFFLSASNTRGFLNYVPLPGAAYAFKAGERLRLVMGIPFVLALWMPSEVVTLTFTYFPLRNAELRLGLGRRRGISGYVLGNFRARNFRLHDRPAKEERLFVEEGLLQAGVNWPLLGPTVTLETGGGLAFARRYFLAESQGNRSGAPTLRPGNVPFGFAKLNLTL